MLLKVKDVDISSGGPLIVILNYKDAEKLDLQALDRIKIKKGKKQIIAAVDISESDKGIKKGKIGLFEEVLDILKVKDKQKVKIFPVTIPESIELIKKKLEGKKLNEKEINIIVKDLVANELTEIELAYFVSACYNHGLDEREITYLTKAIVKNGSQIKINRKIIVDKHCSGGIPGNRTTMIVVPILAAANLTIPKTSSRSITSASGTADTMESLAKVNLPIKKLKKIIKKTNAFIAWGGAIELASADDKLIKVRHSLSLDPEAMLISSILAKKAAVNATHVLIDLPIGKDSKIKSIREGKRLKLKFKRIGRRLGIKIKVILTDGSQPIGNGIGPNLEARDVLYILKRDEKAPKDLERKSIKMASIILKMVGIKKSETLVKSILDSGLAYKRMKEIIKAQEGNPNILPSQLRIGKFSHTVKASKTGIISSIDIKKINKIARIAGSPQDKEAGIYLYVKTKDKVNKGHKLFTIYSDNKTNLNYAKSFVKETIKIK